MATKAPQIKYIVARQFVKTEIVSGMVEGGAEIPRKSTFTESLATHSSKREADRDFAHDTYQANGDEPREFCRFLCEVKKTVRADSSK